MKTPFIFVLMIFPLLFGCVPSELDSVQELNQFIFDPGNNLTQEVTVNDLKISVTYRPTDLLVYQEVGNDEVDNVSLDSIRKKYSDYYYFILSLSRGGKEALTPAQGMESYSEMVQVLSFRMHEYVTMTTSSQDTIPVGDFMLNRTYGIGNSTDILFAFNKEQSIDKEWVQFNLNEFGLGAGNHRFRFRVKDLEGVPRLRFNI